MVMRTRNVLIQQGILVNDIVEEPPAVTIDHENFPLPDRSAPAGKNSK